MPLFLCFEEGRLSILDSLLSENTETRFETFSQFIYNNYKPKQLMI